MLNFDWLGHVDVYTAKYIVMLAFIMPVIFALTLKKSYIYAGSPDRKPWMNLKIWVVMLSVLMLVIYSFF